MRWWQAALLAGGLAAGGFIAGVIAERTDVEPATGLRAVLSSMSATVSVLAHAAGLTPPASIGDRPVTERAGATVRDAAAMAPGLTLLAIGPDIALKRPDGSDAYRWRVPLKDIFTVPALLDPADVQTSGLVLEPDGSVLALEQYERDFPAFHWDGTVMNTALVKLDQRSRLVWSYTGNPHHDLRVAADGTIYVLVAREGATPPRPDLGLPAHFRDEGVAVLDAGGHERRTLWLADAVAHSAYANLFGALDPGWAGCLPDRAYCWNLFHANSIQIVPADVAARVGFAAPGDLLVNLRELDAVLVLDPNSGDVRWAMRGVWRHAHDAELTSQGTLMLFDNRGNIGAGEASRLLEVDPLTGAAPWSYSGGSAHPFSSSVHGTKQILPNGNLLITETMGGRVLEVTRDGRPVWDYVVPALPGTRFAPEIWGGRRIDPAEYPFLAGCAGQVCGVAAR